MRQFEIRQQRSGRNARGYLVILQHDFAASLGTGVVAPLLPESLLPRLDRLRPVVVLPRSEPHVLALDRLAAVERSVLGPRVGDASPLRDEIIAALDLLFTGF